jgi:hypothetical protein
MQTMEERAGDNRLSSKGIHGPFRVPDPCERF